MMQMQFDNSVRERLTAVGTASLSTQLLKLGIRRHWIAPARPMLPGRRIAGPAFTLRFIPGREDVSTADTFTRPGNLMSAIDAAPDGSVLVAEAHGAADSGIIGDILCLKLKLNGAQGVVTDGAVRDLLGLHEVGLPVWAQNLTPPPALVSLWFAGYELPVGVGGVAVFPGDIVVADDDGAIVIPPTHLEQVLAGGEELVRLERFIVEKVRGGAPLFGLYPPNEERRAEYDRWKAKG
jgi:regulator of RNase E activity RraA